MRYPQWFCSLAAAILLTSNAADAQTLSVRPLIGGFPAASGFALGAQVSRSRLAGPVTGRVKALVSVKKYQLYEAGLEVPEIGRWFYADVTARYRNFPEEDFWGLGPDTPENQRSNYLLEDIDTTGTFAADIGGFRAGVRGGYVNTNTGPGRDDELPSVPETLQTQPAYKHVGWFFEYQTLDQPSDPRSGGHYGVEFTQFVSSFQRYVVNLRRFIPIAGRDRLALRLRTHFTRSASFNDVSFFMLPTVGGTDTSRGFHQYRFRDRNAMVLNAEFRRALTDFLDAVAFVDSGRVFSRSSDLGLRHLHTSGGVGTRVKFGSRVFFGVDVGFSREGAHLWFRSEQMF
jgi:hypothetical protein